MPFLVAALLVVAVHVATAMGAWQNAGPLAGHLAIGSAMHCGTALLWFVLVRRSCGSVAAALAAAVLFVGWPGHSEAIHSVGARSVVQSTFLLALALVVHDVALTDVRTSVRRALLVLAAALAFASGSGVGIMLLAAALSWLRSPVPLAPAERAAAAAASTVPMMIAAAVGGLFWKEPVGFGAESAWQAARIDAAACTDWLAVLLAPVHHGYGPANMSWLLAVLTSALFVVGVSAVRLDAVRGVLLVAALVLAVGVVAGIGCEPLDAATLQNVRRTHMPALGLCTLLGIGIAMLPFRARGLALAIVVATHAAALDQNRQPWLRAAAIETRLLADITDVERLTQRPFRVLDAPHEHDGALVWPLGSTARSRDGRIVLSTTAQWPDVLSELAAAVAGGRALADAWTVQWDDGALVPFVLDPRWPQHPSDGTSIAYARIGRVHPFAGTMLPVHVLVQNASPVRLRVGARAGETAWSGPALDVAAAAAPQAVALRVMLPDDVAGQAVALELVAEPRGAEARTYALGAATPVARR